MIKKADKKREQILDEARKESYEIINKSEKIEERILEREEKIENRLELIEDKQDKILQKEDELREEKDKLDELKQELTGKLAEMAKLTENQAKELFLKQIKDKFSEDGVEVITKYKKKVEDEKKEIAKDIILKSIQQYA
ncbi:Rnase Y domain-containing protein [Patescibacteria group bacterium]